MLVNRKRKWIPICTIFCAGALLSAVSSANQNMDAATCPSEGIPFLSTKKMKSRVRHTLPIHPPCSSEGRIFAGALVLEVSVDEKGNPTCVKGVLGDPMVMACAIHSVSTWKFNPYAERGQRKSFCGHFVLGYRSSDRDVKFKLIN
jgi:hypothetical protein